MEWLSAVLLLSTWRTSRDDDTIAQQHRAQGKTADDPSTVELDPVKSRQSA